MCKLGDTSTKKVEVLPVEVLLVEVMPLEVLPVGVNPVEVTHRHRMCYSLYSIHCNKTISWHLNIQRLISECSEVNH